MAYYYVFYKLNVYIVYTGGKLVDIGGVSLKKLTLLEKKSARHERTF